MGCFSIFFPVTLESQLTDTMESFIHKSTIELDMSRKNIRFNYLGDVSQLVSENFELQLQSFDISLKQCAGYGCAIEITAYIQEDSLYICLCSRSKDVSELELRQFFDEIQQEDLVELSDEEFDFLFN